MYSGAGAATSSLATWGGPEIILRQCNRRLDGAAALQQAKLFKSEARDGRLPKAVGERQKSSWKKANKQLEKG